MNFPVATAISIEGLQLDLFVGCNAEERGVRQPMEIDLHVFFPRTPLGCLSDELKDTVCYATCATLIHKVSNQKHFQLIEHLAHSIHAALKKELPMYVDILVRVRKLKPPIPYPAKGVSFTYFPPREIHEKKRSCDWDRE